MTPIGTEMRQKQWEVVFKKRKRVKKQRGTVHVIAICNGLEMAMGFMWEAYIPKHLRWPHNANLFDIDRKYGDVITASDYLEHLDTL